MRGLERLFFRFQTKRRWKVRSGQGGVQPDYTYVGGFLLIFLVLYIVIPQLVETIPGIVSSAESGLAQVYCLFAVSQHGYAAAGKLDVQF